MTKYKRILVGYDGSKYSEAALAAAIDLVREAAGTLYIVTSAEVNAELEAMAPKYAEEVGRMASADLARAAERARAAGVACETEFQLMTDAQATIVEAARRHAADLIVLGTHGRTGLTRLLMGSTTERVIGHAPCAVLVICSAIGSCPG